MKNQAFTLIELLVVVLIIGILVAVALPQYNRAVIKSQLHKGIPLVESIYQAQNAYFLTHGKWAKSANDLDISIPVNSSCSYTSNPNAGTNNSHYFYTCDYGTIGQWDGFKNVQFQASTGNISYVHYLEDDNRTWYSLHFYPGKRYCFAKDSDAESVCVQMGGKRMGAMGSSWKSVYALD